MDESVLTRTFEMLVERLGKVEAQNDTILATLRHCDGDKVVAAELLGITARTIYRREAEWREEEG